MFNLSGGEIVVLLLIGLIVLGPEKLPEAMRKFGRVYNEIRRVAGGIQRDVTSSFSEPVNELRKTADEARRIFNGGEPSTTSAASDARSDEPPFVPYEVPPPADTMETPDDGPAQ
ncbi:MAG: Sec-independent protein translocase subunit TatA/TatB [Ilumatobacteraceae bacterium]